MISERVVKDMVRTIHSFPDLDGCVVGFHGNRQSRVLDHGFCVTPNSERVVVLIEELELSEAAVRAEMRSFATSPNTSPDGAPNPAVVTNRSKLGPELIGMGLQCGLTIVSAVGVAAGAAAEVPSGGTSTFLVVASWTGLVTSGVQCMNGLVRVGAILREPEGDALQRWDDDKANPYYVYGILLVDAIGVASSAVALKAAAQGAFQLMKQQKVFANSGLSFEALKRMNRAERLRVIDKAFSEAAQTPQGREALIRAARAAGVGPGSIQGTTGLSVRGAQTMSRLVSERSARGLSDSLRKLVLSEAMPNSISLFANALPDRFVGSASGSINKSVSIIVNLLDFGAAPAGTRT